MCVDDDFLNAESAKSHASVSSSKRAAGDFNQSLRTIIGQRAQTRAQAGGQHHRLHLATFSGKFFSSSMWRTTTSTPLVDRRCRASCSARKTDRCCPPVQPKETIRLPKAATLIRRYARIDERLRMRASKLLHAFLLIEVLDDRSVFACKLLEALLAPGIGQTARIEYIPSAVS